ncbi:methyltransferase [Temperatibacter marinus]|uniref:Methyltransferase n=1 Tax=Temperatibacter marinus TaxID=1456591 RepID=A0AA52H9T9_9PROT|nr:methyltransferase [Temperatibacter marinus]WND03264.1 methyltransferase [Temperatibacter marinus]
MSQTSVAKVDTHHTPLEEKLTIDDFLGGKIRLKQPKKGYRVSMDTVLLAASVPAKAGEHVLEPGPGSGGASLCLARRVPGVKVTGVELQDTMIDLANQNIQLNEMDTNVVIMKADITDRNTWMAEGRFDHVMVNPPYLASGKALRPPQENKGLAHMDSTASLKDWIDYCLYNLKPKGTLSIVYRADRADEIIARLYRRFGEVKLMPFWPREGVPAKRVIIQARKGVRGAMTILPGMALHGQEERYTPAVEAILRHGDPLIL